MTTALSTLLSAGRVGVAPTWQAEDLQAVPLYQAASSRSGGAGFHGTKG